MKQQACSSRLAASAAAVITDDWPGFFLPRIQESAAKHLDVAVQRVDSNGLLPMRSIDKVFLRAYDFRRHLQRNLAPHLLEAPSAEPLAHLEVAPSHTTRLAIENCFANRPVLSSEQLAVVEELVADLQLSESTPPTTTRGGTTAAVAALETFLSGRLERYVADRNKLTDRATSELSAYLHFGHISSHQIFARIAQREGWSPASISDQTSGAREGWWGLSAPAEAYLDQLVTWRELGFNMSSHHPGHKQLDALPAWAQRTIDEHRSDPRPNVYCKEELESAATHDEIWNAAQRELLEEGRIHNYLRMLWGKKIYEWSATPEQAIDTMIDLNDRYALDGRDPNSYSGIFWCLGRYDRAWGPEREIFGKLRYMSSESTRRKLALEGYLARYGAQPTLV